LFQSSPVPKDGCNARPTADACRLLARFNPHPSRRTGATQDARIALWEAVWFQSSPVPKDGCNGSAPVCVNFSVQFQSSPVPKDGCNQAQAEQAREEEFVSILTRPEGRVQLLQRLQLHITFEVSILTRPEGRVQLPDRKGRRPPRKFQSSPVPKDGCNPTPAHIRQHRFGFNPHPSRRTGATRLFCAGGRAIVAFQSSPVPKDGCNKRGELD